MKKRCRIKAIMRQKLRPSELFRHLFFTLISVLKVISLLNSCSPRPSAPLSYREGRFTAEVSGVITPAVGTAVRFSATVLLEEPSDVRPFTLSFHSPDILSGLTLVCDRSGALTVRRGDACIPLPSDSLSGFIKIPEMLDAPGEILEISSISGTECGMDSYKRLTAVRTSFCTVFIDPHTSEPLSITLSDGKTEIIMYTVISKT